MTLLLPPMMALIGALILSSATLAHATKSGFPPSLPPGCLPASDGGPNLFCPGDEGYGCYKIPSLTATANGTLLAFVEARKHSCDDHGYVDLRLRRSFDGGTTWAPSQLVYGNSTADKSGWHTIGDANPVLDRSTGRVHLLFTRDNKQLFVTYSDDHGATWAMPPREITSTAKYGDAGGWVGTGHAGGIQLPSGRLLVPAYTSTSYAVLSDDHGATWRVGGVVSRGVPGGGECTAAPTGAPGGQGVLMSMRGNKRQRLQAWSADGGESWSNATVAAELPEPIDGCEGSLAYHPKSKQLFFSHPDNALLRVTMQVWSSADMGHTWTKFHTVWPKAAGYSSMIALPAPHDDALGIFYGRNNHSMIIFESQSMTFATLPVGSGPFRGSCAGDLAHAGEKVGEAAASIAHAVASCHNNATACSADIAACVADLGEASQDITAAVTDCGGTHNTVCAKDISVAATDLGKAAGEISKAATDCHHLGLKCIEDVAVAAVDIGVVVASIVKATKDC